MIILSVVTFALSALALHILHARIGLHHPKLLVPEGRVLLEVAPTTRLARRLSQGRVRHPLALAYRITWYVHLMAGLVFAVGLMVSAYIALR